MGLYLSPEASKCAVSLWREEMECCCKIVPLNTEGKHERSYQDSEGVWLSPHTKCFLSKESENNPSSSLRDLEGLEAR